MQLMLPKQDGGDGSEARNQVDAFQDILKLF